MPDGDVIIIAESFSGPLAVALAERHHVAALIFCNSFVVAPRPSVLRWLLSPFLFKLPIPRFLLRRYMLGRTADEDLLSEVVAAIRSVPAAVLASRLTSVFQVDETVAFARCNAPTLYLRGTGDRLIPEAARLRMAAKRPIKTSHVPGPHLLLQANPAGAWKAIVEFLDSLPSPNP
jgi:pimeloyl-ACP methyl ester carboxylesterase